MSEQSLFDRIVDRRASESVKWHAYGEDVLPLWVADMDFASPQPVIDALRERVKHGVFGYPTEPEGLREAVCAWIEKEYAWTVPCDALVFLPNVAVGFNLATRALTKPGDGLLIQTPVYFPILRVPENAGLEKNLAPLSKQADGRFEIDFDAFEQAITDRTKLFMLCNPHNPVGRVYHRDELERMAEICAKHGIAICSDEIHADFVFNGHRHTPIASLSPEIANTSVTLFAPNKTFNIAGISCAVAVVPNPAIRKAMDEAKRGLVPHVSILGYTATLAAYRHGKPWLNELISYLEANRNFAADFVARELPGLRFTPIEGTYLAWLDTAGSGITGNPHEFFLREARVAMNDGAVFGTGGEGYVRLNLGCPQATLTEALERMREAMRRL